MYPNGDGLRKKIVALIPGVVIVRDGLRGKISKTTTLQREDKLDRDTVRTYLLKNETFMVLWRIDEDIIC